MKIMIRVLDGEIVRHVGDLKIRGNVGTNATILVENGSLLIEGDVGEGSRISVSKSETLEPISFEAKSISAHMITHFAGETVYIGHVNVDDRIFTHGQLKIWDMGCYEITTPSPGMTMYSLSPTALSPEEATDTVEAVVDGRRYQGTAITVLCGTVIVDGLQKWPIYTTEKLTFAREGTHLPKVCINGSIADNVTLHTDVSIKAKTIGKHCTIASVSGAIVAEDVGAYTTITAEESIEIKRLDKDCSLRCRQGRIITDNVGDRANILAKGVIRSNNVGIHASLISTHSSVCVNDIGEHSRIICLYDIDILGAYPHPKAMTLKSHLGRIHKPLTPLRPLSISPIDSTGIFASRRADSSSKLLSSAATTGLFAPITKPSAFTKANKTDIPQGFICPISQEIMDDPVLFILDKYSYERECITTWLKTKGTSPMTRAKMSRSQKIEDVLVTNRALLDAIREFKELRCLSPAPSLE